MPTPARTFCTWISVALALLCGACTREAPTPAAVKPRNLVVVTIDTLRADHVGATHEGRSLTPRIDAFAQTGRIFDHVVAPMGTTFPSHSSMFTGLYPPDHGVRSNADTLAPDVTTLAEILREQGFSTAAFVSFKSMIYRGGLGQGFQRRSAPKRRHRESPVRPGEETVAAALQWLGKAPQPFFLWVHLFEPHLPLPVTPHAAERMGEYAGPLAGGASVAEVMSLRGTWKDSPETTQALQALYAGRVLEADALFGRILDGLRSRGALDETLVVVTSDHGELLGERGEVGHGTHYEPAIRVPLVIGGPGVAPGRSTERAGLVDLTPTVLEALDLAPLEQAAGRSITSALRDAPLEPSTYFAEVRVPDDPGAGTDPLGARLNGVAAWKGHTKVVVRSDGSAAAFDLRADPEEERPLPAAHAADLVAAALAHTGTTSPTVGTIDEKTASELRALGYIE